MAHRIRIRDIKGGFRHGKGMRRPLRTAIAVIVATAMLTPTIASAAPVVPDAPSPVPGVESSSPYADTVPDEDTAPQDDAGRGAGDVEPPQDETTSESTDTPHVDEAEQDTANENASDGESADADSTAEEDAAQIDGAEVLSDGGDGTGKVLLADGRDYVGQTVKDINGTRYILIGNEQQLRAIGTGKHVVDKVWHRGKVFDDWKPAYVGDADIAPTEDLADKTYTQTSWTSPGWGYHGSDSTGSVADTSNPNTGLTYSADANYIIFRDIDLSQRVAGEPDGNLWTPLTFSGTMTGAKAGDGGKIWDDTAKAIQATGKPTIAHVTVNHADTKLDTSAYTGIGFFSTLTNRTNNVGMNVGRASVSNLIFDGTSVTSNASEVKRDASLIESLTGILGGLVGGLLDLIFRLIGVKLDLKDLLTSLLTAQNNDPSTFATGAFAGRIVGDVSVHGIEMRNPTVSNTASGMTGGFVGYTNGATQYDGLSEELGKLTDFLEDLLNIIPGLGLGDLITILLDNKILKLDQLIPTGYVSPTISDVAVTGLNADGSTVGNTTGDYAGGFAGQLTATLVNNATVSGDSLNIRAENYAGGFVGLARNGEIQGMLDDSKLGQLEGWDNTPQTLIHGSGVSAGALNVTAGERYAGGFAGGLAATHMVDDGVSAPIDGTSAPGTGSVTVTATTSHAGGFAGIATLGWETDLGKDDASDNSSLLANVKKLLSGILTGETPENAEPLLALVGIKESTIFGAQVSGSSVTVSTDGDHAAGLLGEGRGTVIASVSDVRDNGEAYWDTEVPKQLRKRLGNLGVTTPQSRGNAVTGLASVSAGGSYAGGIAGSMQVANGGGLLNNTLGLVNVMSPVADSVTVEGSKLSVKSTGDYAAGGVAAAVGMISNGVTINGLASVTANNYAGGYMGTSSAGDLVSAGGGINLLGLNLVNVKGLLSVGSAVQTKANGIHVNGVTAGMSVKAGAEDGRAGGFVALGSASSVSDAHVINLGTVQASNEGGYAGGFVGESTTAGLADVGDEAEIKSLIEANGLLGAVTYLLPSYTKVDVTFSGDERSVTADYAGGFAGEFEAGTVDNTANGEDKSSWYAVYGISEVTGTSYAGGFGGRVVSGALAEAGKGISILGGLGNGLEFNLADLVNVVSAYIPTIKGAGVASSERGLAVSAGKTEDVGATEGAAGGFIGYASGAQVSGSHVNKLRHTDVSEPDDLEAVDAPDYFNGKSSYAVKATRYAGGYCGLMDVGSAASVGEGLKILGGSINVANLLGALPVVATTVEHSNVYGAAGGFAVLADGTNDQGATGYAGGFAGKVSGAHVQDSNCYNFSHVIGQVAAGGYAGEIEPGDAADVLGDTNLAGNVVNADNLLSLVQAFVPSIRNSETTSVPCGGVVRAQAATTGSVPRGMAGGYVGHNEGGQIWGSNTAAWKDENTDGAYSGTTREAAAIRIRSVYGAEYAGGFTGLMESASTASTGSLKLLWGLVKVDNLLGALGAVYPTEENTAVYGPLRGLTVEEWNAWVDAVGAKGAYGSLFDEANGEGAKLPAHVENDEQLAEWVGKVGYGTTVVAGRASYENASLTSGSGCAGGYAGRMVTGTVTNGQAHDTQHVSALRAAGGFVGAAETGGAASVGDVGILGMNLNPDQLLGVAKVFVPVIKSSSVEGYRQGMTVESAGAPKREEGTGNAGGYVGFGAGAQIWGDEAAEGMSATGCNATKLRRVRGAVYAGGFAGRLTAGSLADVGTDVSEGGFLRVLLDRILDNQSVEGLAQVLQATMSTVRASSVAPADEAWGLTVEGINSDAYPVAAGGFAGMVEATVLGELEMRDGAPVPNEAAANRVTGLRGVDGGSYAGGFVGLADVGGVAEVADGDTEDASTTILTLLGLGDVSALGVFQPCIYVASVDGVTDGITVRAHAAESGGHGSAERHGGNAGGFAGSIMSGTIQQGAVTGLSAVSGPSYTGGFVGYTGKSGVLEADDATILQNLVGADAGVLDTFSALIEDSGVTGIPAGYTVASSGENVEDGAGKAQQIAGGFVGFADLAHIQGSHAIGLKRVGSGEIAGGFAGEGTFEYLVSVEADSPLVSLLMVVLSKVISALWLDDLQNTDLIDVNLGDLLLHLTVEGDGNTARLTLLGIPVTVTLNADEDDATGVAVVQIGDSEISLNVSKDEAGNVTIDSKDEVADVAVNLIKGNSTVIEESSVTGIGRGYDVFAGGATQAANAMTTTGTDAESGYAGGFMGLSNEAQLKDNDMYYCDVVKGAADKTGPFTGTTNYGSNWWFNDVTDLEKGNAYRVYRGTGLEDGTLSGVITNKIAPGAVTGVADDGDPAAETQAKAWARFDIKDHEPVADASNLADWRDAAVTPAGRPDGEQPVAIGVYADSAKAVLMDDTPVTDNTGAVTPEPDDGQDPCATTADLTVTKVWDDNGDTAHRPNSITVRLARKYTDADGGQHEVAFREGEVPGVGADGRLTITSADASAWTNTWRKVVTGLPAAFDDNGTVRYYSYSVTEVALDGGGKELADYSTTVTPGEDGSFSIVITNRLPLPATGGIGIHRLIILGVLIVGVGILLTRKDTYGRGTGRHRAAR